jgi:hypothetical protein
VKLPCGCAPHQPPVCDEALELAKLETRAVEVSVRMMGRRPEDEERLYAQAKLWEIRQKVLQHVQVADGPAQVPLTRDSEMEAVAR